MLSEVHNTVTDRNERPEFLLPRKVGADDSSNNPAGSSMGVLSMSWRSPRFDPRSGLSLNQDWNHQLQEPLL